jgi:hypothetical protein
MNYTKTGGSAFPQGNDRVVAAVSIKQSQGMTLRDYFAAKAMQGLMDAAMPMPEIAQAAYQMADDMLKARTA